MEINEESVDIPLRYGVTDEKNLPGMTEGKLFATGYNARYGLVNVDENDGEAYFRGRVNIENELPSILSDEGASSTYGADQYVTEKTQIMRLESELAGSEIAGDQDPRQLEINRYRAGMGFDDKKVDSRVGQYVMSAYDNLKSDSESNSEPMLEVLVDKR